MPSIHVQRSDPDATARALYYIAKKARMMPPAWDGAGISIPVLSPGGGTCGRALPGRGLYLVGDLKELGITRGHLPHVYSKSAVGWLVDMFRDASHEKAEAAWRYAQRHHRATPLSFVRDPERGAISTYDGILAARGGGKGEDRTIFKSASALVTVANTWSSLWRVGGMPAAGAYTAIPGGSAPSKDTAGSWSYGFTNPTAPDLKYLLTFGWTSTVTINLLLLVDLLVEAGNIAVSTTGTKTLTTTALTRYTNGKGVLPVFVVTTALGTGTGVMNLLSYTDQDNNTGQVGQSFGTAASTIVERTLPNSGAFNGGWVPLAVADYGVRAISTLNVGTAHSAGVIALELVYPLAFMPGILANVWIERDSTVQVDGLTEIAQTSGNVLGCLHAYIMSSTTNGGSINCMLRTAAG